LLARVVRNEQGKQKLWSAQTAEKAWGLNFLQTAVYAIGAAGATGIAAAVETERHNRTLNAAPAAR